MKPVLTIILLTMSTLGFGQVTAEDIIIVYDSLNPNGRTILKSDLASDLDSLDELLLEETRQKLLTTQDSEEVQKMLTGNWTLQSVKRTNGKTYNLATTKRYELYGDGSFREFSPDDTTNGNWELMEKQPGLLNLNYHRPKRVLPEEILKLLSEDMREKVATTENSTEYIREIDNRKLVLYVFLPIYGHHDKYRLVLMTYIKEGAAER